MKKNILIAVIAVAMGLAGCLTGRAQEVTGFKLKQYSKFALTDSERNPFWPVGWVKAGPVSTQTGETVQAAEIRPSDYEVTGILLGTPPLAVINNGEYTEGSFIRTAEGHKSKVQVVQILDGAVILRYMGREYTIPLHRRAEEAGIKKATPTPSPEDLIKPAN